MASLNADELTKALAERFDLNFSHQQEDFDGEVFTIIRPDDLLRPNGFGVSIARTPRRVEASLRMDRFSRSILRKMGEADEAARDHFALLAAIATKAGVRVAASINGVATHDLSSLSTDEWTMLELDCDVNLPLGPLDTATLNNYASKALATCIGLVLSLLAVEESTEFVDDDSEGLPEGAKTLIEVNRYERSRVNRAACIAHHGAQCQACGFDFRVTYGAIGKEVIEVHHKVPVSSMGASYSINPITDLVPVCANCHRMLHRRNPPYSVQELRGFLNQKNLLGTN
jgi:5-methylcytosine-specific restriction protein A